MSNPRGKVPAWLREQAEHGYVNEADRLGKVPTPEGYNAYVNNEFLDEDEEPSDNKFTTNDLVERSESTSAQQRHKKALVVGNSNIAWTSGLSKKGTKEEKDPMFVIFYGGDYSIGSRQEIEGILFKLVFDNDVNPNSIQIFKQVSFMTGAKVDV